MANESIALINPANEDSEQGTEDRGRRRSSRSVKTTNAEIAETSNVEVEDRQDAGLVIKIRGWRQCQDSKVDDDIEGRRPQPPRKVTLNSRPQIASDALMELDPYQAALPLLDLMNGFQSDNGDDIEAGDLNQDVDGNAMAPLEDVDDGVDYVCVIINGTNWNRRGCNWSLVGDLVEEMDDELDDDPEQTEFWIVPRTSVTEKDLNQLADINDYDLERIGACQSERMRFIKNLFKRCQFRRVRDLYAARRKGHVSIARYISLIYFVRL